MTKQQIINKIQELKKQKQKLDFLVDAQDVRQHSFKIFLNSSYGALGSVFYPCYDLDNAEAVTLSGQTVTREMVRYTNQLLNQMNKKRGQEEFKDGFVIAGDTDSVSSKTKIKIKKLKQILLSLDNGKIIKLNPSQKIKIIRNNKSIQIYSKELLKTDKIIL